MKFALITGGTKGIGRAIAERLLFERYHVILNYANDDETAKNVYDLLSITYPGQVSLIKHNLSQIADAGVFYSKVLEVSSILDVIVLNHGKTDRSKLEEITYEDWNSVIEANLTIPFFLLQKFLINIKDGGCVLFTGSSMGVYPHSLSISYGVSKAAVHALVKNLVKFLSIRNIRVNAIVPGFVDTQWQTSKPLDVRKSIESKIALSRFCTSDEVAEACLFLINCTYMTGELLNIDGGYNYR
jgi:3-oxoacyl-[acyl-carrier protein] reductase